MADAAILDWKFRPNLVTFIYIRRNRAGKHWDISLLPTYDPSGVSAVHNVCLRNCRFSLFIPFSFFLFPYSLFLCTMHLVIFDVDGTLTQTFYGGDNTFLKALSRFIEVDKDYEYWKECPHPTDEAVFQHMFKKITGREATEDERSKMQDQFMVELMHKYKHTPGFFDEVPGASRFLKELHQEPDTIVAIATGGWKKIAKFKLELAGIDLSSIDMIGSDDHHDKPSFTKAIIQRTAEKHDLKRITYVGDSLYDYETTRQLGINFIGIDFLEKGHLSHLTFCPVYTDFREISFI